MSEEKLKLLLQKIIDILDFANEGCTDKLWSGFENGNGEDIGKQIDEFIKEAKEYLGKNNIGMNDKKLKSLEEHNQAIINRTFKNEKQYNGIACPKCGKELYENY